MNTKRDYALVMVIGSCVGLLVLLPAKNIGVSVSLLAAVLSAVGFTLFAPIALFVLKTLGKRVPILEQFGKFAAVGTLNTLIDLGILNALMIGTGIVSGVGFSAFKAISFVGGTTNSYFWNKFWTFQNTLPVSLSQYVRFLLFTLVGTGINVGVASVLVNVVGAPSGISATLWANIGAIIAVFVAMMWNFVSYRKIVFKGSVAGPESSTAEN